MSLPVISLFSGSLNFAVSFSAFDIVSDSDVVIESVLFSCVSVLVTVVSVVVTISAVATASTGLEVGSETDWTLFNSVDFSTVCTVSTEELCGIRIGTGGFTAGTLSVCGDGCFGVAAPRGVVVCYAKKIRN